MARGIGMCVAASHLPFVFDGTYDCDDLDKLATPFR